MNSWLFGVLVCVFPICVPLAVIVINNLGSRRGLPQVFSEIPETPIGHREPLNYGVEATRETYEGCEVGHYFHLDSIPPRAHTYTVDLVDEDGFPVRLYLCAPIDDLYIRELRQGLRQAGYSNKECLNLTAQAYDKVKERWENDKLGETLPGGRASPRDESPPSGVHEVEIDDAGVIGTIENPPGSSVDLSLPPGSVVKWHSRQEVDLTSNVKDAERRYQEALHEWNHAR